MLDLSIKIPIMKTAKKKKKILPEVHILGDLEDVKNLVSGVNKKKTVVIFRDGDQETFHVEDEGEFKSILPDDIAYLQKKYKLIFFSFFPSRKKIVGLTEEKSEKPETGEPAVQSPEKDDNKEKKKDKKKKKGEKLKKVKKENRKKKERKKK